MVTSIVGRFLEHSRIYCFGKEKDIRLYISSADMMTRNTSRRVEIACPIMDADIREQILHILDIQFKDNVKARLLGSDGIYRKKEIDGENSFDSQQYFIEEVISQNSQNAKPNYLFRKLVSTFTKNNS